MYSPGYTAEGLLAGEPVQVWHICYPQPFACVPKVFHWAVEALQGCKHTSEAQKDSPAVFPWGCPWIQKEVLALKACPGVQFLDSAGDTGGQTMVFQANSPVDSLQTILTCPQSLLSSRWPPASSSNPDPLLLRTQQGRVSQSRGNP